MKREEKEEPAEEKEQIHHCETAYHLSSLPFLMKGLVFPPWQTTPTFRRIKTNAAATKLFPPNICYITSFIVLCFFFFINIGNSSSQLKYNTKLKMFNVISLSFS